METNFAYRYHLFLSHSSKDKKQVHILAEQLKKDGLKVWLDEWEVKPGNSIIAKINEGLRQSRIVVCCYSTNARSSEWVASEVGAILANDPLGKDGRLIVLCLEDVPVDGLEAQHCRINLFGPHRETGYKQLVKACRELERFQLDLEPEDKQLQDEPFKHIVHYSPAKLPPGTDKQVRLRARAMTRVALTWLLADQLPSGGWGRSLIPWMKANWKGDPISPDPLMEEEGGLESSILSFHILYHCCTHGINIIPHFVLSGIKTYIENHQDPKTGGFGIRSMNRDGIEMTVRLRHTALGAYGLLLLNQVEKRTFEKQATQALLFLFRQQNLQYADDRNGSLLYVMMNFLYFRITNGETFNEYQPSAELFHAMNAWHKEHEPAMRREFLRLGYHPFGKKGTEICDPFLAPYGGFPRMMAYTLLTACQFATEQSSPEVMERLCAGLRELIRSYESHAKHLKPVTDPLKPRIHGVRPWRDAECPDLGTTALLLAALSNKILRRQLTRFQNLAERYIQAVCVKLLTDLTNLFDRYLIDACIFEYTHASTFAFVLLASNSGLGPDKIAKNADKVSRLRRDEGLSEQSLVNFVEENIFEKSSDLPTHIFTASIGRLLLDRSRPGRYPEGHLDFVSNSNKANVTIVVNNTLEVYKDPVFIEMFCGVWASKPIENVVNVFASVMKEQGKEGGRVLDVGSGPGQNARLLYEKGMQVTLLDASGPMLERAKENLSDIVVSDFIQMDVRDLSRLGDAQFDGIWCSGTMIHFPEPLVREVIRLFDKLLAKDGVLMINCAIDNPRLIAKDGRFFAHWRDQEHFAQLLTAAGFEIVHIITDFVTSNTYRESSIRIRWDNFICVRTTTENHVARIGQLTSTAYDLIVRRFVAQHKETYNKKLVQQVVNELRERKLGRYLLDAGCGPGHYSDAFARHGFKVTGIDLSSVMIQQAKASYSNCTFAIHDFTDLKFAADFFDCIFCMAAFQHIPLEEGTARKTLQGFHRVLKKGGLIMLNVQIGRETGFEPDGRFTQGYESDEVAAGLLEQCGFEIIDRNLWALEPKKNSFQIDMELKFCDFLCVKV